MKDQKILKNCFLNGDSFDRNAGENKKLVMYRAKKTIDFHDARRFPVTNPFKTDRTRMCEADAFSPEINITFLCT